MSIKIKVRGIIGWEADMKPRKIMRKEVINNVPTEKSFMYFKMYVNDTSRKVNPETNYYPSMTFQVILEDNQRNEKLFGYLTAGRNIEVTGFYTDEKNGEFFNRKILNPDITFLDKRLDTLGDVFLQNLPDAAIEAIAGKSVKEAKEILSKSFKEQALKVIKEGQIIQDKRETAQLPLQNGMIN